MFILIIITSAGCNDETGSLEYDVLFVNLPGGTNIVAGNPTDLSIQATVRHKGDSSPAKGVRVEFFVTSGSATIPSPVTVSDGMGIATTLLRVSPNSGENKLQVAALVTGGQTYADVTINGVAAPASIKITQVPGTLYSVRSIEDAERDVVVEFEVISLDVNADTLDVILPLNIKLRKSHNVLFGHIEGNRFYSDGEFGEEHLVAVSDLSGQTIQLSDTCDINILPLNPVSIHAIPNLHVFPDSVASVEMTILTEDYMGVPCQGLIIDYSADWGQFGLTTDTTDDDGEAKARWTNDGKSGTVTINVRIRDSNYYRALTYQVVFEIPHRGLLRLTSDKDTIVASNGQDIAHLLVRLRNGDGQDVPGKSIQLRSTYGLVTSSVVTDVDGSAKASFRDQGLPSNDPEGNLVPAMIYATSADLGLIDSVAVTIRPRRPVGEVILTTDRYVMLAGSRDSASMQAIVTLEGGEFAPPGTLVNFEVEASNGMFFPSAIPIGAAGRATSKYIAGNILGKARLRSSIVTQSATIYSNMIEIELVPGEPANVRLSVTPNRIPVNSPDSVATVTATVTDSSGNPVLPGTLVSFSTTLGEITQTAFTDEIGHARARLIAGVNAGIAEIVGKVAPTSGVIIEGRVTVAFQGGIPDSISLFANPGIVGFGDSTIIFVTVLDSFGNAALWPSMVIFELPARPDQAAGCRLRWGNTDSARTSNGIAVTKLIAGNNEGYAFLRAYTFRDPDSAHSGEDGMPRTDTLKVEGQFVEIRQ